ncbi:MAG: LD-carboxypeptidase [Myxococcales bacterium]|nr:LD-carboxypeptidase [Myxococcales bacterium]
MGGGVAVEPLEWVIPPGLAPRSIVRVVAPSGPFDPALVWRGLGWLAERYRVRFDRGIFERAGYLAGSDARRRDELASALEEPDIAAILCSRGGYGTSRYAHTVDFSRLRVSPRWLVGFSDVTALHVEATRHRVASLHAPNVTGLGRGDAVARAEFARALEQPLEQRTFAGLRTHVQGGVTGRLFGGNLTLLHACAAAGRLHPPAGGILVIEDVGERPYRIDRMLATLVAGGHLARLGGIVVADFTECAPTTDGVTVARVIGELLEPLGIPLASGLAVGHGVRNMPVAFGVPARLEALASGASLVLSPRA